MLHLVHEALFYYVQLPKVHSGKRLLVCDLQGVEDDLTDPQVGLALAPHDIYHMLYQM